MELLGRKCSRDSRTMSFKCSSLLAESCVSALCGSTKSCRPAQHGDSDNNSRAHQNPFTLVMRIYPTSLRLDFLYSLAEFSQSYTVVPWGMHFKTMSGMPHFLWFLCYTKMDSTPQHIRWPLQYLFNTHMISNTCPSSHTWYLLWYDKEQGRWGRRKNREEFVLPCGFGLFWGAWSHASLSLVQPLIWMGFIM